MKQSRLCHSLVVLATGIFTIACSGIKESYSSLPGLERNVPAIPADSVSFIAYLGDGSRTQLGEELDVLWSEGDKVRVFTDVVPSGAEFNLIAGAGTTQGVFVGPAVGEGPYYAIYPSQAAVKLSGDKLTVNLPSSQSYETGSFGQGASISAGMSDRLDGLHFHNVGGILQLTLAGSRTITGIRVRTYGQEPLFGSAVIDGWESTVPSLTLDAGQTDEAFRELFLYCKDGVMLSEGGSVFNLAVPPGTLGSGYWVEVYDSDGLATVKYARSHEDNRIDQGEIVQMPSFVYRPHYKADYLRSEAICAFSNAGTDGQLKTSCLYVEGQSQYAYMNTKGDNGTRYIRLEDWNEGFALGVTMSYELTPGKNNKVSVSAMGAPLISSGEVESMQVIKVEGERVWMFDPDSGQGFIVLLVED